MKKSVKKILPLAILEFIFLMSNCVKMNSLSKLFLPESLWIYAYMIFMVCAYVAMTVKKPAVFFPVFAVCTVAQALLAKKTLVLLAPIALMIWLYLNLVEKLNSGGFKNKADIAKAAVANVPFFASSIGIAYATYPLNTLTNGYVTQSIRSYQAAVFAFIIYLIYSLAVKSNFPHIVKARKAVKKYIKEQNKQEG